MAWEVEVIWPGTQGSWGGEAGVQEQEAVLCPCSLIPNLLLSYIFIYGVGPWNNITHMASGFQSVDCYAEDFQKKVGRMILGLKTGAKTQLTKDEKN